MTVPEWQPSRLGESYYLTLSPLLVLTVVRETQSRDNPSPTPYAVMVFGGRLARRWATVEEAKAAAIRVARQHLTKAADAILDIDRSQILDPV